MALVSNLDQNRPKVVRPSPADFDKYLSWACGQLQIDATIMITRTVQAQYVSATASERSKMKAKQGKTSKLPSETLDSETSLEEKPSSVFRGATTHTAKPICIETIYDADLQLVKLRFANNRTIPRAILQIIGLIIQFHPMLYSIVITSGVCEVTIYELAKLLPVSHVTEICLDNTQLKAKNYYILLKHNALKYLSLAKCGISDDAVKDIASELEFNNPASQSLSALNLATNRITDLGCEYLAKMLRSNRHLGYLNLADNMITDNGAAMIFDVLLEFPLTEQENTERLHRYTDYMRNKKQLVQKSLHDLHSGGEFDKQVQKRKVTKSALTHTSKKTKGFNGEATMPKNDELMYLNKAVAIAEGILGSFQDPFGTDSSNTRHGLVYCLGNNTLSYLNLAYNSITYPSVQKLYKVVSLQKYLNRKPGGLVNIIIDGNNIPNDCQELKLIDKILEKGLDAYAKKKTIYNKMNVRKSFTNVFV